MGFNSATTFQPWRHFNPLKGANQIIFPVSIRPRLFSHGDLRECYRDENWKERFNSATTFQPWRLPYWIPKHLGFGLFQFGHDFSAMETALSARCPTVGDVVSIRPRLFSHGDKKITEEAGSRLGSFNSATTFQPWRPQPWRRGIRSVWSVSIRPRLFSHGDPVGWLEISDIREIWSFNSATTFQPWRRGSKMASASQNPRVSIRPRLFSHGDNPSDLSKDWTIWLRSEQVSIRPRLFSHGDGNEKSGRARKIHNCFNSATTFQPWRRYLSGSPLLTDQRFNSATTFQPWRRRRFFGLYGYRKKCYFHEPPQLLLKTFESSLYVEGIFDMH